MLYILYISSKLKNNNPNKSAILNTFLLLTGKHTLNKLDRFLKNILYIEGLKDYIKIYEENSPKPILSLMSMKSIEELLPASRFIRVHRSYIVQKDKIRIIDRGRIVFGKNYIPVSDSYKQIFQDFLNKRS